MKCVIYVRKVLYICDPATSSGLEEAVIIWETLPRSGQGNNLLLRRVPRYVDW